MTRQPLVCIDLPTGTLRRYARGASGQVECTAEATAAEITTLQQLEVFQVYGCFATPPQLKEVSND